MARPAHFSRFNAAMVATLAVLLLAWTSLALHAPAFRALDDLSLTPHLTPRSPLAQLSEAFAIVTHPAVMILTSLVLAYRAWQRRLRHLAGALAIAAPLAWLAAIVLKLVIRRPRPPSPLGDAITYSGYSYPSSHLAVATCLAVMVVVTGTISRQSRASLIGWRIGLCCVLAVLGANRLVMNAHWFTDVIGGTLTGALVAALVTFFWRIRMLPPPAAPVDERRGLVAVVFNPTKLADEALLRRQVADEAARAGWRPPLWLPTSEDDPGHAMTRQAIERGASLVLAAGGDGTVRVVTGELRGSTASCAIIPAGTGNLLARNLGVPLDQADAVRMAFHGRARPIDLVRVTVDHRDDEPVWFTGMAGIGFDAAMMSNTDDNLKKAVGNAAYVVAFTRELGTKPLRIQVRVDDGPALRRRALLIMVGNTGSLQAGIELFRGARPDDGELNLLLASPRTLGGWARLARAVIQRPRNSGAVDYYEGRRITVRLLDGPASWEVDGDTQGTGSHFDFRVEPGAVQIVAPTGRAVRPGPVASDGEA